MNKNDTDKKKPWSHARKGRKKIPWKKLLTLSNLCFTMAIVLLMIGGLVIAGTIRKGGKSAKEAYMNAESMAAEETYNKIYDAAFEASEKKYHVKNNISIDIASIQEEAKLEVLRVSDVEYVIESKKDNDDGIEVWMEFYGDGVFTVDMKASEFIIDYEHQYVLVRVPRPELTNCRITQANQLFWQNGICNKSISVGTDKAVNMRNDGYKKLKNYMKSNTKFYKSAKTSAQIIISDLVRKLNPRQTSLVVEVEFVD